ncbi:MAG: hypothetical protein Q4C01_06505 [Clostridia bacterium]|nr:hypothetical protein [Clostridia bacterium]
MGNRTATGNWVGKKQAAAFEKLAQKIKQAADFEEYVQRQSAEDIGELVRFFDDFSNHCALNRSGEKLLRQDFENALLYYETAGVPLRSALERLSIDHLGGFYTRPPILYYALDDAAKIYPLSMKPGKMAVFRLSVYLNEPVIPVLLQMALTFTIKRFPSFATTVKKGFFWHYLDTAKHRYVVQPENGIPCQALNISRSASQSFRVLWYENRISVEFFHILTDGTGGMSFLKALTAEYLRLCGIQSSEEGVLKRNETPTAAETENSFARAESAKKSSGFIDVPATQMSGRLSKVKPCRVLHFIMDAQKLKAVATTRNATITAYVLSKMFLAGKAATDELDGTINIQVPVNMRKFYPSETVRNFALYCGIRLPIAKIANNQELIQEIAEQLASKASREAMSEMMSATKKMVDALRYVPLVIKAPVARIVYGFLGDGVFSNTLSNLGVVTMPSGYAAHIQKMDSVLGTSLTSRAGCSMVTFGNIATLSIAKRTADPSFEEEMFRLFSEDGIIPEVEGSELYER